MRALGIIYLLAYLIDLSFSIAASFAPGLEGISNGISSLVTPASIAVLILACLNKLRPRRFFIVASSYYLIMAGTGLMMAIALLFKLGFKEAARQLPEQSMMRVLCQQFAWYGFLFWTLLAIWTVVGLYGLRAVVTAGKADPGAAASDGSAKPPPIPSADGGMPLVG